MVKEIERIITRFKQEVGKTKQMTSREMKLIEICIDELVVKNCSMPGVSNRRELLLAFLLFINPEFESPEDFVINYERLLSKQ